MNAYRARPLKFPWPPAFYAIAFLLAYILGEVAPLAFPDDLMLLFAVTGCLLIASSVAIDLWAYSTLRDGHTTMMSNRCTSHLVTNGPYRFSRNPIYLSYSLLTLGIGLVTQNPWFVILTPVFGVMIHIIVIRAEEMHLLARFGFDFEHYRRTTRCWI